jgi:hypothetical protein
MGLEEEGGWDLRRKAFFFEKKKQKTFGRAVADSRKRFGEAAPRGWPGQARP